MQFNLRPYNPETDFDEMFSFAREIISEPPYAEARQELLEYPQKQMTALVAVTAEGDIIAFCAVTHPYWNKIAIIDYLVVKPEWRNQGVGGQLHDALESKLKEANVRIATVQTASWNAAGIRFYERLGYQLRFTLPGYYGENNDMVWLDRSLER